MREEGLQGKVPKRVKRTTDSQHDDPIAANLLDRDFTAAAPNQRWVGDTTEFVIGDSGAKLYLAAILDLYSRFVVGWAISAVNDRRLTLKALEMAVQRRVPSRVCCTTRIGAARTRARTTKRTSRPVALRAA
jgi:putative transposase